MEESACACLKDKNLGAGCKHLEELGWDDSILNALIAEYCPVLYLHPKEKYLPSSVDWFLARCSAVQLQDDKPVGLPVVPAGQLDVDSLPEVHQKNQGSSTQQGTANNNQASSQGPLALWLPPEHWAGQPKQELNDIPLYVRAKLIHGVSNGKPEALELSYIALYPYNGSYHLFGIPWLKVGAHVGDIEHLTVLLSLSPMTPTPTTPPSQQARYTAALAGVWYNAHRNCEGEWADASTVPRDPATGRIVAYVAKAGHGNYPKVGTVLRLFCAANDCTSDQGLVWRPNTAVFMVGLGEPFSCCLPNVRSRGTSLARHTLNATLSPLDATAASSQGRKAGASDVTTATPSTGGQDGYSTTSPSVSHAKENCSDLSAAAGGSSKGVNVVAGHGNPPVTVVRDARPWQRFTGSWGTAEAFSCQGWFNRPEPSVSRTFCQRWCYPCAPEAG